MKKEKVLLVIYVNIGKSSKHGKQAEQPQASIPWRSSPQMSENDGSKTPSVISSALRSANNDLKKKHATWSFLC